MWVDRQRSEAGYQMFKRGRAIGLAWSFNGLLFSLFFKWNANVRTLLLAVCLTALTPALYAQGSAPAKPVHPLIGTWTWSVFAGSCTETLQYRPDGSVLATSGQEVAEKTYEIAKVPDASGFYQLVETVIRQNDKRDCSGALLQGPGDQSTRFVQFSPLADKLLICREASLKACFGPLAKVQQ